MTSDTLLDALNEMAAESKTLAKKPRVKSELGPTRAMEFRQVYNWVLQDEVKLIVEDTHCENCGCDFEVPCWIMLSYLAFHNVRGKKSPAFKWKRAEPQDALPENPKRLVERFKRSVGACHKCWDGVELEVIKNTQPQTSVTVAPSPELEELFPGEGPTSDPIIGPTPPLVAAPAQELQVA